MVHRTCGEPNEIELTIRVPADYSTARRRVHNLTIDYVGQWNEHDAPAPYAAALRSAFQEAAPWTTVRDPEKER